MLAAAGIYKEYETDWLEGYIRTRTGYVLDESGIRTYQQEFDAYVQQGLLTGSFDAASWTLHDVQGDVKISFSQNKVSYMVGAGSWIGLSFSAFCRTQHAYVVKRIGTRVSATIKKEAQALVALGDMSYEDMLAHAFEPVWLDYLSLLPGDPPGRIRAIAELEEMERHYKPPASNQRTLAPLSEYLSFDEKLRAFFQNALPEDALKYYPLRLWWDVGTILPLRVTEFLLTPWDCLRKDEEDRHFLTVRRSKKKKGSRLIYYDLDHDYGLYEYHVAERLAKEIKEYQALAPGRQPQSSCFLFPSRGDNTDYLNYKEMTCLLREFCDDMIGMAGCSIRLGDTRHLAMINAALNGAPPEMCMELAGQEDIDIASNYYSNISSFVDSAIMYRVEANWAKVTGMATLPANPETMVEVEGGWCDHRDILIADVGECLKNYSRAGHLGDCYGCVHFHPDGPDIRVKLREEQAAILNFDWDALVEAVNLLAQDKGCKEDVMAAMARLKNSMYKYASFKMWEQEDKDGKKEEE